MSVLLVPAVALVFAQSAGHGFVNFDDPEYVQDNLLVAPAFAAALFGVRPQHVEKSANPHLPSPRPDQD